MVLVLQEEENLWDGIEHRESGSSLCLCKTGFVLPLMNTVLLPIVLLCKVKGSVRLKGGVRVTEGLNLNQSAAREHQWPWYCESTDMSEEIFIAQTNL